MTCSSSLGHFTRSRVQRLRTAGGPAAEGEGAGAPGSEAAPAPTAYQLKAQARSSRLCAPLGAQFQGLTGACLEHSSQASRDVVGGPTAP